MPAPRKEPAWVAPFLAALAACGNVTRSAALAGVDVTGVYNRRSRYPDFKAACERVLAEREMRAASFDTGSASPPQDERVVSQNGCPSTIQSSLNGPPPHPGEELVVAGASGVRLGRVAASRWSKGTEERFLEELTACANVARAAAAVGFSAASAYKRRARERRFADGWDAAIAVGRARLEAHLIDAADRTFDPEALPVAEGAPKVTVGEAISILKHQPAGSGKGDGRSRARAAGYADFVTDEDVDIMERAEEAKKSIYDKLARLLKQDNQRKEAAGWTWTGEDWIPPGWGPTP